MELSPQINPVRFKDRVAVVTGGGSGIGAAVAERLALEGASVIAADLDEARLQTLVARVAQPGVKITPLVLDITNDAAVAAAFAQIALEQGRLDVLVHSAGIVGPTNTKITDYSLEAFEKVLRVNLTGTFICTKNVLPHMAKHEYGRIMLLASMAGKEGNPGMVGYTASKGGVISFVKGVGKEVAATGITVNGLAPAVIRTPMNEDTAPEQLKYMLDKIPMKRMGTVEEVAALIAWVVSEEASFCTGFVFDASGGRAVY